MWAAVSGRESAVISVVHLLALSTLRPKPAARPKVTAAPYICPPALCPSPSVLGTVGVGVSFFGQGRAPGSGSKGGRRACRRGDRGLEGGGFVLSESFFLSRLYQTSAFGGKFILRFWGFWGLTDSEGVSEPDQLQVSSSQKHDNQKDWCREEKFFSPWQQWHADRRSPASEAPVAAGVWLWSPVEHPGLFTKTQFPGCRARMCVRGSVCCVCVCASCLGLKISTS